MSWSTQKENLSDRKKHGTELVGSRHGRAKLNAKQVLAIRASTVSGKDLAAHYGVSDVLISLVRRRKCWRHI